MKRVMEFEKKLLRRVALVRKKRGITQRDVAARIGIDQSGYSRMERGDAPYPLRSFIAVCKFIEFPFVLFDGEVL